MTLEDLEKEVATLRASSLVHRDIVARLMAYVAAREPDVEAFFEEFSQFGDDRIDSLPVSNDIRLALAEAMRQEKDWIVAAARRMTR